MGKTAKILTAIAGVMTLSIAAAQVTTEPLAPKPAVTEPQLRPAPITPAKPASTAAPQLTAEDVNAWLDGFLPYGIGKGDIPGAVVVIVKDGQILTSRGYGYADVSKQKKVDPASTLFRPGSVSKLFTWTALMQQVELGKVDLNADVNQYIDFKIPPYEGKPITVLNLMTHTPGLEEQVKDLITLDRKELCAVRRASEALGPQPRLCAGIYSRLFELRRQPGRLHRPARIGRAVRHLCGKPHLHAARHAALDVQPAAAGKPQAADGGGLCLRQGQAIRI